jgi:hypothetical protein
VFWGGELRSSRAVLVWFNCFYSAGVPACGACHVLPALFF